MPCNFFFNQSPALKVTDVDLKLEAGSSLGLSLDMRSTRVHSRRLTTVLITDAAKRWNKSSVYMSLPLTKGYFFSLRVCTLRRQSDGARVSEGNRSRVDFIDVILLIYTAVKGGGEDLKWGGRRKSRGQTQCLAKYGRANGSRKRILILILHTQIVLYSPSGSSFSTLRRQKARRLSGF